MSDLLTLLIFFLGGGLGVCVGMLTVLVKQRLKSE